MRNVFLNSNKDAILTRKFCQYMLPGVMMAVGISLNEFVDAIVVSNLLGETAMTMVSMGSPLLLLTFAVIYLLGQGGSIIFGICLGGHDRGKADRVFSVTVVSLPAVSLFLSIIFLMNLNFTGTLLCRNAALLQEFKTYLIPLIVNIPVMVVSWGLAEFLPSIGRPNAATAVSILSNITNLIMDYVYIRFGGMGIAGASLATLTGNIAGLIFVLSVILVNRSEFSFRITRFSDLRILRETLPRGGSDAVNQFGLGTLAVFYNYIAVTFGGNPGLILISVCYQITSILSIIVSGVRFTISPILAVLKGQEDYKGIRAICFRGFSCSMAGVSVLSLIFSAKPGILTGMFNVTDETALKWAGYVFAVYCLGLVARYGIISYINYLKTVGLSLYAVIIQALSGFAIQIPVAIILTGMFGINGLWWTNFVAAVIVYAVIAVANTIIIHCNPGRYSSILLFEKDTSPALYISLSAGDGPSIAGSVQKHVACCPGKERLAVRAAAICEDMVEYTSKTRMKYPDIDLIVKVHEDRIVMDFRNIGKPLDILAAPEPEQMNSLLLVRKAADEILYDRVLGINMTRMIINAD